MIRKIILACQAVIFLVALDCRNEQIVVLNNNLIWYSWGPDTNNIAYVVKESIMDDYQDYRMVTYIKKIHENQNILFIGRDTASNIDWSPSGDKIAIVTALNRRRGNIWIFSIDRNIPPIKFTDDFFNNTDPSFSPDGRKIAFTSGRFLPEKTVICLKELNKDTFDILTQQLPNSCKTPHWHPNGKDIIFTTNNYDTNSDIYQVNVETREITPLINSLSYEFDASYSPDGKYIVFIKTGATNAFVTLYELKTRKEYTLSYLPAIESKEPRFTPDGKGITFLYKKESTNNFQLIYVPFRKPQ